jgi:hypothetical protein
MNVNLSQACDAVGIPNEQIRYMRKHEQDVKDVR